MPAIADFAALKEQIASFLNKTNLTAQIPVFVGLCEEMMRRRPEDGGLWTREQETTTTGTLTGETLEQPEGLTATRRLTVGGREVKYQTPQQYQSLTQRTITGSYYTVIGSSYYILGGNSGDEYELTYSAEFADLAEDDDTNWVLENAPSVYLMGSCHWAAVWLKDAAAADGYLALYNNAVNALTAAEKRAQTSGTLYVRSDRQE